jgi:extracellular factor (EF) 3-hydroxypalmitic acid methyl ester biosynthesis protein
VTVETGVVSKMQSSALVSNVPPPQHQANPLVTSCRDGFEAVTREVERSGAALWARLQEARGWGCVTGAFAEFAGSSVFLEALEVSKASSLSRRQIIDAFRRGASGFYLNSGIWRHCIERPYGYRGDFALLELVYDQRPHSGTTTAIGALVDTWAHQTILPRAVRARKDILRVLLERFAEGVQGQSARPAVLSVGSGASRELREMRADLAGRLEVTLLDSDARALRLARARLTEVPGFPAPTTVRGNALTAEPYAAVRGPFGLIYSFGLFDYLSDRHMLLAARRSLAHLAEDGLFIFCLKDQHYYPAWFYEWCLDWRFIPRTRHDGLRLAETLGLRVAQTLLVDGGVVCIFVCRPDSR